MLHVRFSVSDLDKNGSACGGILHEFAVPVEPGAVTRILLGALQWLILRGHGSVAEQVLRVVDHFTTRHFSKAEIFHLTC
jgi:hypothetical protein